MPQPRRQAGLVVVDEGPRPQVTEGALLQAQDHGLHAVAGGLLRRLQGHRAEQAGAGQVVPRGAHRLRVVEGSLAKGDHAPDQGLPGMEVLFRQAHGAEVHPRPRSHLEGDRPQLPPGVEVQPVAHHGVGESRLVQQSQQRAFVAAHVPVAQHAPGSKAHLPLQVGQGRLPRGRLDMDGRDPPLPAAVDPQVQVQPALAVEVVPAPDDVHVHVAAAAVEILDLRQVGPVEPSLEAFPHPRRHRRPQGVVGDRLGLHVLEVDALHLRISEVPQLHRPQRSLTRGRSRQGQGQQEEGGAPHLRSPCPPRGPARRARTGSGRWPRAGARR